MNLLKNDVNSNEGEKLHSISTKRSMLETQTEIKPKKNYNFSNIINVICFECDIYNVDE